jgi:epoxyqueuosine reductase
VADTELLGGLREAVLGAGIDLVGVTSAEPLAVDDEDWWGHDQPRDLLPEARSVVLAGFCIKYEPRVVPSEPGVPRGRFTPGGSRVFAQMERHCWDVIGAYLRAGGYTAVEAPRIPIKPAIVRSGLGSYGKHGVTITKELGSMLMWGAVVTDAPLADPSEERPIRAPICPDACRACVDACPTGALPGDYTLDRSKCITNWLWGAYAPADLREHQQDRMFGCGECLAACPANRQVATRTRYPVPVDGVDDCPELLPLVAGDMDYYDRVMPTFPRRAGPDTIRGNAIVALGNNGDPAGQEALENAFRDENGQNLEYASWALARIRAGGSRPRP